MDEARTAADIWAASAPNTPAALLAYYARNNIPFPDTDVPVDGSGLLDILAVSGWTAQRYGFRYLLFHCPRCRTGMFQPVTAWGMRNARAVADAHLSIFHGRTRTICDRRLAMNAETVWPDSLMAA